MYLSFQEDASRDVFNSLREKLKLGSSRIRQSSTDYLCYTMIDLIVDHYFVVMDKLGEQIEDLEEEVVRNSNNRILAKINLLRKELIVLKRNIAPVRDLVNGFIRSDSDLLDDRSTRYFKDIYDHIVQANDLSETYRDMMINMQDLYISNVNLKLNEVMKVMADSNLCIGASYSYWRNIRNELRNNSLCTQRMGIFSRCWLYAFNS